MGEGGPGKAEEDRTILNIWVPPLPTPFKICMLMHHNDIIIEKHTLDLIIIQLYKDLPLPTLKFLRKHFLGGKEGWDLCISVSVLPTYQVFRKC